MSNIPVITISRQYGSGGSLVGQRLAADLGIPFYDNDLITLAAQKSGYDEEMCKQVDEQAGNSLLYMLAMYGTAAGSALSLPLNDQLFLLQSNIIRDLARQGPCVIIGRCGDYVLEKHPNCVNLFLHADIKKRIDRAGDEYGLMRDKAEVTLIKTDKRRATYYSYYTGQKWGRAENYHLSLDTGALGLDGTATVIKAFLDTWQTRQ